MTISTKDKRAAFRSPTTAIDAITQREMDELIGAIVPEAKAFQG